MKREGMTEKEARQRVINADHERAAYYDQDARGKWGKPESYDLCINTDHMSWVGRMNNIRQQTEEIILEELIYR